MAEESIQFIANFDKFVSIKKLTIDKEVGPKEVIEFLTSVQFTTSQKIKDYIGKIIDVKSFDEKTKSLYSLNLGQFMEEVNSKATTKIIKDFVPSNIEKKEEKDAYIELLKVYLIEKYAAEKKIVIGAHHIVFPANKKLMKKK
jgi:predicted transcriptional regulator